MDTDIPPPESFNLIILSGLFNPLTATTIALTVAVVLLVILSALISGSEVAFFSMKPKDLEGLNESDSPKDKNILQLLSRPRILLSTILVANSFVNIGIILINAFLFSSVLNLSVFNNKMVLGLPLNTLVEFLLATVLTTFVLVLFGEVTPKTYANQNRLAFARRTSGLLTALKTVFYPISVVLMKSGVFLEKKLHTDSADIDYEEIDKAIDLSIDENTSKEDVDILKGIIHLGNTTVKQIMKPRVDVVGIEINQPFTEVKEIILESGFSRMPVYNESLDNIEGALYIKDLLEHINTPNYNWQNLIRKPFFVPESKKIDDLLQDIQQNRKHLAIVVDEYGGTEGIITLEDILEEVVGEIKDEFDETEFEYKKLDDHNFIFEGKAQLNDFFKILNIDEDSFEEAKGEAETLAGLVLELMGKIPKRGDTITHLNYKFLVLEINKNRIEKIKVTVDKVD